MIHAAAFFANQNSVDNLEKRSTSKWSGNNQFIKTLNKISKNLFIFPHLVYTNMILLKIKIFQILKSTPYAISKKIGEDYVEYFCKRANKKYLNLRLFNNYGPGELPGKYRNVILILFIMLSKIKT